MSLDGPGQTTNIQKLDISGPACRADLTIGADSFIIISYYDSYSSLLDANNLQGMTVYIKGRITATHPYNIKETDL